MKRWDHVGGHIYCEFIRVFNGEWVKADIAEKMHEALKDVCSEICPDKDREECPNGYNKNCFVLKALQKARGE